MLFNSLQYIIFLVSIFVIYWSIPHKYRWFLLLIASYFFYIYGSVKYTVLLLLVTMVGYFSGLAIEYIQNKKIKKIILYLALTWCLGILFIFKYFEFFLNNITLLLNTFSIPLPSFSLRLLLPVGISFYTFQVMSYVIDVYKGAVAPEHNLGLFMVFISFFPQLVAGPIEKTDHLLPQLKREVRFNYNNAVYGLRLILWGYFKKLIIADMLAVYVDAVYGNLKIYSGFALVIVMFFFTIQIYCDFSGYSDIAIGTAKLFGINLMINFKSPYYSTSIKEFWHRWHISLSTWFRDYIYIPLGGGLKRHYFNLFVTFLVSGLWHGSNWTFILWGAIHGGAQVIENILFKDRNEKNKFIKIILVFGFCNFAWIFFRAQTISDAIYFIKNMWIGIGKPTSYLLDGFSANNISFFKFIYILVVIGILAVHDFLSIKSDVTIKIGEINRIARWAIYVVLTLWIIFFSQKGVAAEFIYFQF